MKVKTSARMQLLDCVRPTIIFYGVCLALSILLVFFITLTVKGGYVSNVGGVSGASVIFIFVMGLCTFKENFLLHLQHGVSRRSLFWGHAAATLALAAAMTVLDLLLDLLLKGMAALTGKFHTMSLTDGIYNLTGVAAGAYSLLFQFATLCCLMSLGYFITALYYRMGPALKVAVSVGVPGLLLIGLPILDAQLFGGAVSAALGKLMEFAFGTAGMGLLSLLVLPAALSALAWLLIRRATVKN